MAILIFTFTGHGLLSKQRPAITSDNLETNVRKWADDLGLILGAATPLLGLALLTVGIYRSRRKYVVAL